MGTWPLCAGLRGLVSRRASGAPGSPHRIQSMGPDHYQRCGPQTLGAVRRLFADAGVRDVEVIAEEGYQLLRTPENFWTIAMGSGLRWTIDQMGAEAAHGVKQEILDTLIAKGVDRVGTNVIYAVAGKDRARPDVRPRS